MATAPLRFLLLLLACLCSVMVLFFTRLIPAGGQYSNVVLLVSMWGISAGFIRGVGFTPRFWLWRIVFSASLAWLFMILLLGAVVSNLH